MSTSEYRVLARRLRPQKFADVVSQSHVTDTLQNAIRQDRVAQAYLFSGPRGTGKTTTARLLAMALNCEQGPSEEPCGACASCTAIRDGRSMDVLEIDGASNRGIDEVRQLREEVGYAAVQGRRKVYIIDEVHMLTKGAFNALLKTLEEPPPHVVFVFATTEPHRMPETILSRCQRYNFRRIPAEAIAAQLRAAAENDGLAADEAALFLLARKADGAMRDALSLLDQVVSFATGDITAESVQDLLGLIPRDLYFDLTQAVLDRDGAAALRVVGSLVEAGGDIGEFTDGLMEHLRHLMVACAAGELADEGLPQSDLKRYGETAQSFREMDLLRMLQVVSDLALNLGRVSDPRFWLELTVMKLVQLPATVELSDLLARMDTLEGLLGKRPKGTPGQPAKASASQATARGRTAPPRGSGAERRPPAKTDAQSEPPPPLPPEALAGTSEPDFAMEDIPFGPPPIEAPASEPAAEITPLATPVAPESLGATSETEITLAEIHSGWDRLVQEVKGRKISLGTFLSKGKARSLEGRQLLVAFEKNLEFHANQVRRSRELVESVAAEIYGTSLRIQCEVDYESGSGSATDAGESAKDDDRVQMVLQIFGGDVVG